MFYFILTLTTNSYNWLLILVIGIVSTLISLLVVQFTNHTRNHHTSKLINEVLGKVQFSFAAFFFTIVAVEDVFKQTIPRELNLIFLIFLMFFIIGIIQILRQDTLIKKNSHICIGEKQESLIQLMVDLTEDLRDENLASIAERNKVKLFKSQIEEIKSSGRCDVVITNFEVLKICKVNLILFVISCIIAYIYIATKLA